MLSASSKARGRVLAVSSGFVNEVLVRRVVGVACADEDCVWAFVLQASVRCGSGKENERCRRHLRNVQDCRMCRNNMHIADAPSAGFPC